MQGWIIFVSVYCFLGLFVGYVLPLLAGHAEKNNHLADRIENSRWRARSDGSESTVRLLRRRAERGRRWRRPASFSWWAVPIVVPVWIVNLVAYGTYRDDQGSAVLAGVGVSYFIISVVLLGLIGYRYQRGDERPFPFILKGMRIGRRGRRVIIGAAALGFLIFMIWANRPL